MRSHFSICNATVARVTFMCLCSCGFCLLDGTLQSVSLNTHAAVFQAAKEGTREVWQLQPYVGMILGAGESQLNASRQSCITLFHPLALPSRVSEHPGEFGIGLVICASVFAFITWGLPRLAPLVPFLQLTPRRWARHQAAGERLRFNLAICAIFPLLAVPAWWLGVDRDVWSPGRYADVPGARVWIIAGVLWVIAALPVIWRTNDRRRLAEAGLQRSHCVRCDHPVDVTRSVRCFECGHDQADPASGRHSRLTSALRWSFLSTCMLAVVAACAYTGVPEPGSIRAYRDWARLRPPTHAGAPSVIFVKLGETLQLDWGDAECTLEIERSPRFADYVTEDRLAGINVTCRLIPGGAAAGSSSQPTTQVFHENPDRLIPLRMAFDKRRIEANLWRPLDPQRCWQLSVYPPLKHLTRSDAPGRSIADSTARLAGRQGPSPN